jgi:hypothetical protein
VFARTKTFVTLNWSQKFYDFFFYTNSKKPEMSLSWDANIKPALKRAGMVGLVTIGVHMIGADTMLTSVVGGVVGPVLPQNLVGPILIGSTVAGIILGYDLVSVALGF